MFINRLRLGMTELVVNKLRAYDELILCPDYYKA